MFLVEDLQALETITPVLHEDYHCSLAWRDSSLRKLEAAEELDGYKEDYDSALDDKALWIWQKPPVLKFMGVCKTALPCAGDVSLEISSPGP